MATTRVSTGTGGTQSSGGGSTPMFSPDGSSVVFDAGADLAPGGNNGDDQVVIKNLTTGTLTLVSSSASGAEANAPGPYFPVFSPDGTLVAFESSATNLSPAAANSIADEIYAKNLNTGAVTLVSSTPTGVAGDSGNFTPTFSPNGNLVAFDSYSPDLGVTARLQVVVKNITTGAVSVVSTSAGGAQANTGVDNFATAFSPDNTEVAFSSTSSNLVAGDTAGNSQVFVKNINTGAISIASANASGSIGNAASDRPVFSPDGTMVAFESTATNLVAGATSGTSYIYTKNLTTGALTIASTSASGTPVEATHVMFSPDGKSIAFESADPSLPGSSGSGVTNIYVKNIATGAVTLESATYSGAPANGSSFDPAFAPNSSQVVFDSGASNLVMNDTNGNSDIFTNSVACYRSGTHISVARDGGIVEIAVEDLTIGDLVVTASGEHRPIRWLGWRSYSGRFANRNPQMLPVCFKAGSLADNVPTRDLWVSPKHAMYLDDVLVPAEHLVNGVSVIKATRVDRVDYYHVELDSHDVLLAEGAPSESFIDDGGRQIFHNAPGYAALYPEAPTIEAVYCTPRVESGYKLEMIRQRILARTVLRAGQRCRSASTA